MITVQTLEMTLTEKERLAKLSLVVELVVVVVEHLVQNER